MNLVFFRSDQTAKATGLIETTFFYMPSAPIAALHVHPIQNPKSTARKPNAEGRRTFPYTLHPLAPKFPRIWHPASAQSLSPTLQVSPSPTLSSQQPASGIRNPASSIPYPATRISPLTHFFPAGSTDHHPFCRQYFPISILSGR